jgi:hypothetical protein
MVFAESSIVAQSFFLFERGHLHTLLAFFHIVLSTQAHGRQHKPHSHSHISLFPLRGRVLQTAAAAAAAAVGALVVAVCLSFSVRKS